jgi:hypothetical protein
MVVSTEVQTALAELADSLRPNRDELTRRRSLIPPPAAAPVADELSGMPTLVVLHGRVASDAVVRREFNRVDRLLARATVSGNPVPLVTAHLLSRLGQPLTDVPVSCADGLCEVSLALGAVGPGDYVIQFVAVQGADRLSRLVAFRLMR